MSDLRPKKKGLFIVSDNAIGKNGDYLFKCMNFKKFEVYLHLRGGTHFVFRAFTIFHFDRVTKLPSRRFQRYPIFLLNNSVACEALSSNKAHTHDL